MSILTKEERIKELGEYVGELREEIAAVESHLEGLVCALFFMRYEALHNLV
jgi:hypothetical protein